MKSKLIIFLFITVLQYGCVNSETISGYWTGSIGMNGKIVDLSVNLNSDKQTFYSYDLMLIEQPIRNLKINNGNINFSLVLDVELNFKGELKNNQINGTVEMQNEPPNMNMIFNLTKQSKTPEKSYSIKKLSIRSNNVVLSADIYKPKTKVKHPALVLLHGSSSNLKSNYYFYADFFANQGFEVLIFDKRGNGESTGNRITATYENLAEDAVACLEILNKRETVDKSKIGLWGLSQGAVLLPFISSKTDIPSFLIAVSPDINGAYEAGAYQDSLRIVNEGYSPADGQIVAKNNRKLAKMIRNGCDHKEALTYIIKNTQKYSFMNRTGLHDRVIINKETFEGLYWSGRKYNFYNYWENLKIPTLVLFGSDDEYVDALKNKFLLDKFNNEKIETTLFPRANHVLKKTFNPKKYPDFDFPRLIEGYSDYVEKWIEKKITKR